MVILLHTCFCTQLHTNWRTCAHTNSLRIHNLSVVNFETYGHMAKICRREAKEFCKMFCLLALLIYTCVLVWKKGFLCGCPVERKPYCISSIVFLHLPKMCKRLPNKVPLGKKNHKNEKKILANCPI